VLTGSPFSDVVLKDGIYQPNSCIAMTTEEVPAKRYTIAQVAEIYKISVRTTRRYLKTLQPELGKRRGHWYSPEQVTIIFNRLGAPLVVFWEFFLNHPENPDHHAACTCHAHAATEIADTTNAIDAGVEHSPDTSTEIHDVDGTSVDGTSVDVDVPSFIDHINV
jgi:hypothetical protein